MKAFIGGCLVFTIMLLCCHYASEPPSFVRKGRAAKIMEVSQSWHPPQMDRYILSTKQDIVERKVKQLHIVVLEVKQLVQEHEIK